MIKLNVSHTNGKYVSRREKKIKFNIYIKELIFIILLSKMIKMS
jgi:hypothetical protein